jgi:hypothetical protein
MAQIVTDKNATIGSVDFRWIIDASDLELPPGKPYPNSLETTLGNGHPFIYVDIDEDRTAKYRQEFGILSLYVFND